LTLSRGAIGNDVIGWFCLSLEGDGDDYLWNFWLGGWKQVKRVRKKPERELETELPG